MVATRGEQVRGSRRKGGCPLQELVKRSSRCLRRHEPGVVLNDLSDLIALTPSACSVASRRVMIGPSFRPHDRAAESTRPND